MLQNTASESERPRPARAICWTAQADARLGRLVAQGVSIRGLAKSFGIGRQAAQQRATKLGLITPQTRQPASAPVVTAERIDPIDAGREALPAGHPITWGMIVQGTCLEGTAYPAPKTQPARLTSLSGDAA